MKKIILASIFTFMLLSCRKELNKQETIIHVPDDIENIQEAINRANDFDTILVENGEYNENLIFNGRRVCLVSNYYKTKDTSDILNTIINGNHGSIIRFQDLEDSTSIIDGFSIINGTGTSSGLVGSGSAEGGGIFIKKSNPTLKNLIISNNSTFFPNERGSGGGIFCYSGTINGSNLTIRQNSCGGSEGGGAIHCENSTVILKNCVITNNSANRIENSGGIFFKNVKFQITDSRIEHNYIYYPYAANIISDSEGKFISSSINDTINLPNSSVNFINCTKFGIAYP